MSATCGVRYLDAWCSCKDLIPRFWLRMFLIACTAAENSEIVVMIGRFAAVVAARME